MAMAQNITNRRKTFDFRTKVMTQGVELVPPGMISKLEREQERTVAKPKPSARRLARQPQGLAGEHPGEKGEEACEESGKRGEESGKSNSVGKQETPHDGDRRDGQGGERSPQPATASRGESGIVPQEGGFPEVQRDNHPLCGAGTRFAPRKR